MSILGDINQTQNQSSQSVFDGTGSEPTVILSDNQVVRRYQESYSVARTANAFGKLAKLVGFASAGVIGFIGLLLTFIAISSYRDSGVGFVVFLIALVVGAIIGAIFYVFGIVLSTLAQNLMAALDGAVYASPFLTQEQKAQAMNIKK
jgi:hypothetical protein